MDTLQLIAHPKRRAILEMVWSVEISAGEIAGRFDVTFGAISQHLSLLRDSGLVAVRKDGTRRLYRAERERFGPLRPVLEAMWSGRLDALADAVEESR